MRYVFGLAFALLLSASAAKTPDRFPTIHFAPIPLNRDDPGRREYGALTLLGSWRMTSSNPMFGGISSMRVDGRRFMVLSDWAQVVSFSFDGQQRETPLRVRPLPGIYLPGLDQPDRDSESMTFDKRSGRMWVGFEASNSIRAYTPWLGAKRGWVAPLAMAHWPENAGPEAIARLSDGRFLVFAEEARGPGPDETSEAIVFAGDPIGDARGGVRFYYKPPRGFDPTDAVELPDGRVLILNRHFSVFDGVSAALTLIDPRDITGETVIAGQLVAKLAPPLNIDNMEALAIDVQNGRIILWIASDDNFNPLQQAILLKFAFDPPRLKD